MGVYASLLALSDVSVKSSLGQELTRRINSQPDPANAAGAAVNTVVTLSEDTVDNTGGDFTLTVTLPNGETFTTAAIAYNAAAATIEGAIDTAATSASITGWTNADISVSGGNMQTADVVLTFDGTSVAGRKVDVVFTDSMTGGTSASPIVVNTTVGQSVRNALGFLVAEGVITSTLPAQDAAVGLNFTLGPNAKMFPSDVLLECFQIAASEDNYAATYHSLIASFGFQDKAPLVPHTGNATRI